MEQKKAANPSIEEVLAEKDANKQKEIYNEYVSNMTPKHSCFWNCIKAFLVGGSSPLKPIGRYKERPCVFLENRIQKINLILNIL